MTADVAFETPEEIREKLAHFEEIFKYRYTERDEGYRIALQRTSRWYQVPHMHPWPPHRPYSQRRRRGGYRSRGRDRPYYGRPRYYHDDWDAERDRGHRWLQRSRSPYRSRSPRDMDMPPGYHGDRSPHSYHSHPSHHHHRHSSRSPNWHHRPRDYDSPSPPHHHPSHLSPHHDRSRSRSHSPRKFAHGEEGEKGTSSTDEAVSTRDKEEGKSQEKAPTHPPTSSLLPLDLGGFGESQEKVVPSESDVLAILSTASTAGNIVTSENLKQVQKEAQSHMTRKEWEKDRGRAQGEKKGASTSKGSSAHASHSQDLGETAAPMMGHGSLKLPPMAQHASSLLVSHGKTKNVSTSLLRQGGDESTRGTLEMQLARRKRRQKRKIVISDDEDDTDPRSSLTEDEPIDVVGTNSGDPFNRDIQDKSTAKLIAGSITDKDECLPLVLHLDKQYYIQKLQQESVKVGSGVTPVDVAYTAVHTDPASSNLVIRPQPSSRSSSPAHGMGSGMVEGEAGREEGERRRKAKKKKKKKKGRHAVMETDETGMFDDEVVKPLKLKISIGSPDT